MFNTTVTISTPLLASVIISSLAMRHSTLSSGVYPLIWWVLAHQCHLLLAMRHSCSLGPHPLIWWVSPHLYHSFRWPCGTRRCRATSAHRYGGCSFVSVILLAMRHSGCSSTDMVVAPCPRILFAGYAAFDAVERRLLTDMVGVRSSASSLASHAALVLSDDGSSH